MMSVQKYRIFLSGIKEFNKGTFIVNTMLYCIDFGIDIVGITDKVIVVECDGHIFDKMLRVIYEIHDNTFGIFREPKYTTTIKLHDREFANLYIPDIYISNIKKMGIVSYHYNVDEKLTYVYHDIPKPNLTKLGEHRYAIRLYCPELLETNFRTKFLKISRDKNIVPRIINMDKKIRKTCYLLCKRKEEVSILVDIAKQTRDTTAVFCGELYKKTKIFSDMEFARIASIR